MNCPELKSLHDEYRDGGLDPHRAHALEQHLADCPDCEKSWRDESAWLNILAEKTPVGSRENAQAFTANVLREWQQSRQPSVIGRILRLSAAAAVIAMMLSLAAFMATREEPADRVAVLPRSASTVAHPISVLLTEARRGIDVPRQAVYQTTSFFNIDRAVDLLQASAPPAYPN